MNIYRVYSDIYTENHRGKSNLTFPPKAGKMTARRIGTGRTTVDRARDGPLESASGAHDEDKANHRRYLCRGGLVPPTEEGERLSQRKTLCLCICIKMDINARRGF